MKKILAIFFGLALVTFNIYAQKFSGDLLLNRFKKFRNENIYEKIFISTDRQVYLVGEIMWFKLFCLDGTLHAPIDVSKVAYVEIINRNNEPVAQGKVELKNGIGSGTFFIPTSLPSDNYVIRGYTNWMKNNGPEFYFHQVIALVNPFVRPELTTQMTPKINVDFFPEGGQLVNSVSTKVAYRVSASTGELFDYRCFLLNDRNDTLQHFSPGRSGIGHFEIMASRQEKYRVMVKVKGMTNSFYELPPVNEFGYSLKLIDKNDQLELLVNKVAAPNTREEDVVLFAHTRYRVIKNEKMRMLNQRITFLIDKKDIPPGITHFTIFNEDGVPVNQRLFCKLQESAPDEIVLSKMQTGLRSKNILKLPAALGNRVSISISKVDSLPSISKPLLPNYLSIVSDLTNVDFSFFEGAIQPETLDDLVLTNTWERFTWESILSGKVKTEYLPEARGHVVNATVTNLSGSIQANTEVYLSSPGKVVFLNNERSNADGKVSFEMNHLKGNRKLIAQTNRLQDSVSIIKIENPFSQRFAKLIVPKLKLTTFNKSGLLARSVSVQAQNIFFEDLEGHFSEAQINDSSAFYGKPDEAYRLDEYTRFPVMEEVMREYVPGVVVRKKKDKFLFFVVDKKHNSLQRGAPLILLDGVPVFDANEIMQFDPLKIQKLEIVSRKYFHGDLELAGIVSYTTYQGDLGGFMIRSKNGLVEYEGVQLQRFFYSPSYNSDSESRLPDPRYLLYWNSAVDIPTDEKGQIEFYSSDVPGTYRVNVEGITNDGKPVQASTFFTVTEVH